MPKNILKYWQIFQEFLKVEYCPAAAAEDEHLTIERCSQDLADAYPIMLDLVIQHFFNDGALHICQVAGVCDSTTRYSQATKTVRLNIKQQD